MRIYYYGELVSDTKITNKSSEPVPIKDILEDQFGHLKQNKEEVAADSQLAPTKPRFIIRHYQNV